MDKLYVFLDTHNVKVNYEHAAVIFLILEKLHAVSTYR